MDFLEIENRFFRSYEAKNYVREKKALSCVGECEELITQTAKIRKNSKILRGIWFRAHETKIRSNMDEEWAGQGPKDASQTKFQGDKSIRSKYEANVFYVIRLYLWNLKQTSWDQRNWLRCWRWFSRPVSLVLMTITKIYWKGKYSQYANGTFISDKQRFTHKRHSQTGKFFSWNQILRLQIWKIFREIVL